MHSMTYIDSPFLLLVEPLRLREQVFPACDTHKKVHLDRMGREI